jgi:multidrug efflux system membrane fusion protein
VDIGNQISSSDTTGIVVLTQTHPIDLVFTLPENDIATVIKAQKAGQTLSVEAWDRTNKQKLTTGTLLSLDNQIDATTGTIKLKARFDNQDDTLPEPVCECAHARLYPGKRGCHPDGRPADG